MKTVTSRLHVVFINTNTGYLIPIFVLINFLISYFFSAVSYFIFDEKILRGFIEFKSIEQEIVVVGFIGPIIETLVFQYGIIETLKPKIKYRFIPYLVSAIVFGLSHFYNPFYCLFAIFSGLFLCYVYYLGSLRKQGFLLTLLVHMCYNLVVSLLHRLG